MNIPLNVLAYMNQNPMYVNDYTVRSHQLYEGIGRLPTLTTAQKQIITQEFAISSMRHNFPPPIRNQIPRASELMSRPNRLNVVPALMVATFKVDNTISRRAKRTIRDFGVQAYESAGALEGYLRSLELLDEGQQMNFGEAVDES